jgi:hypothetical protein
MKDEESWKVDGNLGNKVGGAVSEAPYQKRKCR